MAAASFAQLRERQRLGARPGNEQVHRGDIGDPGQFDLADLRTVRDDDPARGGRQHALLDLCLGSVDVRDPALAMDPVAPDERGVGIRLAQQVLRHGIHQGVLQLPERAAGHDHREPGNR